VTIVEPIDLDEILKKLKELEKKPKDRVVPPPFDPYLRDAVIQLTYTTIALSRRQEKLQKRMLHLTWVLVVLTIMIVILTAVEAARIIKI